MTQERIDEQMIDEIIKSEVGSSEKFYLKADFNDGTEDMELDLHANQLHISMLMVELSMHLNPEILGGVISALQNILIEKSKEINNTVN